MPSNAPLDRLIDTMTNNIRVNGEPATVTSHYAALHTHAVINGLCYFFAAMEGLFLAGYVLPLLFRGDSHTLNWGIVALTITLLAITGYIWQRNATRTNLLIENYGGATS